MYLHIFVACQTTKPSSRNNVVSMFADSAEKRQHALRNGDVEHRQAHCSVATLLKVLKLLLCITAKHYRC